MKKYCRPLWVGLTLFFAANPFSAQPPRLVIDTTTGWKPDTVSVEEMKRSFYDWMRGKPQKPEAVSERFISGDALFRVAATDADLSKDRKDFYLDSPKLQELISPFSPALPPSLWEPSSLYVGRTGLTKPVYLEWKGPRPYYSRGVDQEALKQKVKELSHGTATWFTGPISLSSYTTAVRYCNNYITTTAKVFEVEKGTQGKQLALIEPYMAEFGVAFGENMGKSLVDMAYDLVSRSPYLFGNGDGIVVCPLSLDDIRHVVALVDGEIAGHQFRIFVGEHLPIKSVTFTSDFGVDAVDSILATFGRCEKLLVCHF